MLETENVAATAKNAAALVVASITAKVANVVRTESVVTISAAKKGRYAVTAHVNQSVI